MVKHMPDWSRFLDFMDFCAAYYTIGLVRCAVFSFMLIGLVMLFRKVFFSERTFLRGLLWLSFLLIPFLGKLKLFYENKTICQATWWITYGTMHYRWVDRIYMAGIVAAVVRIFWKRLWLRKLVAGMETVLVDRIRISVMDMNITPFTVGLLKPKIVIPRVILESYGEEELMAVIRHERTHIRLGHLWIGLAWDILRCLLWVNPLLSVFQKQFRTDMEDICDRVCIQSSGRTAHEYGLVLLKTMKLLCFESERTPSAVTFAREREFADMKRRMNEIAGFRPYPKRLYVSLSAVVFLILGILLFVIHTCSYPRYTESRDIMIGHYDGKPEVVSYDTAELNRMISYDDRYVYVEREAFEHFLEENDVDGEIWIVFGGFYKLPGFAGAAEACIYEKGSKERIVRIPYDSIMDDWYLEWMKLL